MKRGLKATAIGVAIAIAFTAIMPTHVGASSRTTAATPSRGPRAGSTLGVLSLPTINVRKPLVVGIDDMALARGLGLWPGTPIPGDSGNAVIAGHRTSHGAPMLNIDRLKVGDPIFFTTTGRAATTYEFRITKRKIVTPDAMWITRPTSGTTLTLFACHPPHSISFRYVIFAKLVSKPQRTTA